MGLNFQVSNSPFNEEQADLLNRLVPTLSEHQRIWLTGYLTATGSGGASQAVLQASAVLAEQAQALPQTAQMQTVPKEVTVLYGSQTGNCSQLSGKLTAKLEQLGYKVTRASMADFKPGNLKKVQHLLILTSTHGEGEPPDQAIGLYEFLHSKRAPQLPDTFYSVLALGDTSYEFFCQTGKDFDLKLEELGASKLAPRTDCDVDFDSPATEWMEQVIGALELRTSGTTVSTAVGSAVASTAASSLEESYSRSNPFAAEVLENLNLNGRGSARETRHLELSLEGSGLHYEPGDSLGIYPQNDPKLVDDLIEALNWNPEEEVQVHKQQLPLREALTRVVEITVLTKPLLQQIAGLAPASALSELLAVGHEEELRSYISRHDLLDLVQHYELTGIAAGELVPLLRKIPPRLYSIASSPSANPEEVHITVRTVRYENEGRERSGVCSVQLAERVEAGDALPVFIQHNAGFKLPEQPDTPIIMIGPGTGVAPFRAFLGEREETGAEGKSWLFYGDQHFATDFLYQIEWQKWIKSGVLTRMDVAFSRDTEEKVYVQHRMLEHSRELYEWLQAGAYIYVCGDEKKMAHDVHAALIRILEQEGGRSADEAAAELIRLQQEKRYQRDVY